MIQIKEQILSTHDPQIALRTFHQSFENSVKICGVNDMVLMLRKNLKFMLRREVSILSISSFYSSSSGGTYHSCGGSLVAPDIVLSAAHCYKEYRGAPIVIIGDHDFDNPNDGGEQFDSEVLSIHPNWDKRLI